MTRCYPIFLILFTCIISSCNGPLDKTYDPTKYVTDLAAIRNSDKVSYEDLELLTGYITLSKFAGKELEGQTYAGILDKIKQIRKANEEQSNHVNLQRESARERLRPFLGVNIAEKNFAKINNKDALQYNIMIRNTSNKKIRMVIGSLSLNDLLDREIKNIPLIVEEPLVANQTLQKKYSFGYDHGNENDKQIRIKNLVDLRVIWNPVKIVFDDGTAVE